MIQISPQFTLPWFKVKSLCSTYVSAYHDTEGYDEYELKEKMGAEDFDKMQAYKIANGQVNANPLVDKDGMINLAMDYESEQESEGIVQKY